MTIEELYNEIKIAQMHDKKDRVVLCFSDTLKQEYIWLTLFNRTIFFISQELFEEYESILKPRERFLDKVLGNHGYLNYLWNERPISNHLSSKQLNVS